MFSKALKCNTAIEAFPTLPDLATLLLYKTWLYSHVATQQLVALPVKYITSACADCTEAPQWPFRHTETATEAAIFQTTIRSCSVHEHLNSPGV